MQQKKQNMGHEQFKQDQQKIKEKEKKLPAVVLSDGRPIVPQNSDGSGSLSDTMQKQNRELAQRCRSKPGTLR